MLHHFLKAKSFVPSEFHDSFFDIDFQTLYQQGYRYIITDLDNTLISYQETLPTDQIITTFQELKDMGYELVLLSNNHPERIRVFCEGLDVNGFANARKPLLYGINKAFFSMKDAVKEQTLIIGDQLVTDIFGANRFGVYNILVNPLKKKTEKWYTKMNRKLERKMLDKIKRQLPKTYEQLGLEGRK